MTPSWTLETQIGDFKLILGIDEAGRGALAGPVAVAGVILPAERIELPYRDSKTLKFDRRMELAEHVKSYAVKYAVKLVPAAEIDSTGILKVVIRASEQILQELQPEAVITDYLKVKTDLPLLAVPKADGNSYTVAAASLLAKTARDQYMIDLHEKHPEYGFAGHKGYGTQEHVQALQKHGVTPEHRKTFAPVAQGLLFTEE
ncbi:ribonuclease HII [Deinococcus roseus]|uniref:Ribonuclease n=1 Tax=Deinococcus roseus TaxID=392414 RepID=A0ABQ2CXT3_9DEIO|nr:ribonuclease HII [Deinococcus roseus]GGJ31320.1 ribonuclease HII [Deinococcus roseus]